MIRKLFFVVFCSIVCFASRTGAEVSGQEEEIVFAGSGANLLSMRILAERYTLATPEVTIKVPASIGSKGGIRAVSEGAIDVGLVSRPLKEEEKTLGLTLLPYARIGVVIAAHPSVTEDGITVEEFLDILKGTKTRWKDGNEIIVLTREPGDSSIEVLQKEIPQFKEVYEESQRARRWMTLFTDQEMARALARIPYALGLSDTAVIASGRLDIKALTLNGIPATQENISSGKYPLLKTLSFVYRKDRIRERAKSFIHFAFSSEGRQILLSNGCTPAE